MSQTWRASLADNAVIEQVLREDIFRMRLIRSKFCDNIEEDGGICNNLKACC